jgi:multicomponent Na+:H+ antiporter subunit B
MNLIDIILFALLAATAIAIIRLRDLFASVMLMGIFSLLTASLFVVMDAVDVAFTEASVGAGISTILMLATLARTRVHERESAPTFQLRPFLLVVVTGAILVFATLDMPPYGDPADPIHHHVAPRYIEDSPHEIGIPNIVTSVLASYRGYDTFGETTVIFTAAIGVLLLLGHRHRHRRPPPPKEDRP